MQPISILTALALMLSCTVALHIQLDVQWRLWKETYNKQYSSVEEPLRYGIPQNSIPYESTSFLVVLYGKKIGRRFKNTTFKLILAYIHIGSE